MNIVGAVISIAAAVAVGFAILIILDQRFEVKEKLRGKLPVLKKRPWLPIAAAPVFEAVLGITCIVMRIPEIAFYVTGGIVLGIAVGLMEFGGEE